MNDEMSNYIERYWRDATPADAIKEPPMMARFKKSYESGWKFGLLTGCDRKPLDPEETWFSDTGCAEICQVYDAPDPGEGWRLIDPEKDKPQEDDEIYERETRTWRRRLTPFQSSALSINRRRIEQPKPKYEPFRWEDREQLRGRWIVKEKDGYVVEEIAYRFDSRAFEIVATNLLQDWRFMDTGEPVGRKIQ